MKQKAKRFLVTALKLFVAFGLVGWLIESGKLNLKELAIFVNQPEILFSLIAAWTLGPLLLGASRWFALLRGINLPVPFSRTLQLHLIGFFFNTAMPGAVGGDIIKAMYVMRDHQTSRKTPAMLTILLDRIIGLLGLFTIGAVAVTINFSSYAQNPALKTLMLMIYGCIALTVLFFAMVFTPFKEGRDPFVKLFSFGIPGFSILKKIYLAFRAYREAPFALIYAWSVSVVIQTIYFGFFYQLTVAMTGQTIDLAKFASIFPIGIMTTALPLAPGGLGVGHVAFDHLFEMIGLKGGANVFNAYFLGQMALSMTGIFPYLAIKSKLPTPETLNAEDEKVEVLANNQCSQPS